MPGTPQAGMHRPRPPPSPRAPEAQCCLPGGHRLWCGRATGPAGCDCGTGRATGPPGLRHPLLCPWTVQSSSQSSRGKTLHNLKASPLPKLLTTVSLGEAVCPGQREGQILGPRLRGPRTSHVIPFSWNPVPTFYALVTAVSLAFYTCHACGSFIF